MKINVAPGKGTRGWQGERREAIRGSLESAERSGDVVERKGSRIQDSVCRGEAARDSV
jgi:hypothetical protein